MKPGDRLKRARENKGLTQAELAARFGLKRPAISNWERSENLPKGARLSQVAETLGVTTEWILSGKESGGVPAVATPERPAASGLLVSTVQIVIEPADQVGLQLLHEGQVVAKFVLTPEQARDLRAALERI